MHYPKNRKNFLLFLCYHRILHSFLQNRTKKTPAACATGVMYMYVWILLIHSPPVELEEVLALVGKALCA